MEVVTKMQENATVIDHGVEALTAVKKSANMGKSVRDGSGDVGAGYLDVAAGRLSHGGAEQIFRLFETV